MKKISHAPVSKSAVVALAEKPVTVPILDKVREYFKLRSEGKTIDSRMKVLADDIKKHAAEFGNKDDKGSSYEDLDGFTIGSVAKTSVKLNQEEALKFLKQHNYMQAINTVEVVNEKILEDLVSKGKISMEDLKSFTNTSTTYSVDIREKAEMPEVEQTQLVAASKKRKG